MEGVRRAYEVIGRCYRRRVWDIVYKVAEGLGGNSLIADLGCGDGHNSIHLIVKGMVKEAVLLDISESMIRRCVKLSRDSGVYELTHQVIADLTLPPLRSYSVDAVLATSSIHHLTSDELRFKALREALRMLRKGGKALITVWARWQLRLAWLLVKGVIRYLTGASSSPWDTVKCSGRGLCREYHLYSLKELVRDSLRAGFKVVEEGVYMAPGRKGLPRKNYYVLLVKE